MKSEEKTHLSRDEYFMDIAGSVSTSSECMRRQVEAVIVKDRRILCTVYNRPPTGIPHCEKIGCLREQLGIQSGERQCDKRLIIQSTVKVVNTNQDSRRPSK